VVSVYSIKYGVRRNESGTDVVAHVMVLHVNHF